MNPTRLTELLGLEHPIVQGPFGGGLSSVALAAAVSGDGGRAGPNVTRRVLGVAQWAMGKRA